MVGRYCGYLFYAQLRSRASTHALSGSNSSLSLSAVGARVCTLRLQALVGRPASPAKGRPSRWDRTYFCPLVMSSSVRCCTCSAVNAVPCQSTASPFALMQ